MAGLGTWFAAAYLNYLTPEHLTALFDVNTTVLIVSRIPQMWQNYVTKNTGQLSSITYGLNLAGTLARIFTTMQAQAGAVMLRGFILCTYCIDLCCDL